MFPAAALSVGVFSLRSIMSFVAVSQGQTAHCSSDLFSLDMKQKVA